MTSSPGFIWQSRADISRADVQDVVRYTAGECSRSLRKAWHLFVKGPSPQIFLLSAASFMYFVSVPTKGGLLKSIIYSLRLSFLQVSNRVMRIHPGHSGRFASFVVGGQSRFAPCPPTKYESNPVSEQVPCLGFTHISWVLNRYTHCTPHILHGQVHIHRGQAISLGQTHPAWCFF